MATGRKDAPKSERSWDDVFAVMQLGDAEERERALLAQRESDEQEMLALSEIESD